EALKKISSKMESLAREMWLDNESLKMRNMPLVDQASIRARIDASERQIAEYDQLRRAVEQDVFDLLDPNELQNAVDDELSKIGQITSSRLVSPPTSTSSSSTSTPTSSSSSTPTSSATST